MKRIALLVALAAASPLTAQVPNTWEGEAMVGLAGQNDVQKVGRVKLSPVGLNIGFIVQPIFGFRNLSLSDQVSFYPAVNYDRPLPFDTLPPPRTNPLIINTFWFRLGTDEPEAEGKNVFFVGLGGAVAAATPRDGDKVSPMVGIGMRRWWARQLGFEVSLQCSVLQIGRTACQLPISSLWPFGGGPPERQSP